MSEFGILWKRYVVATEDHTLLGVVFIIPELNVYGVMFMKKFQAHMFLYLTNYRKPKDFRPTG